MTGNIEHVYVLYEHDDSEGVLKLLGAFVDLAMAVVSLQLLLAGPRTSFVFQSRGDRLLVVQRDTTAFIVERMPLVALPEHSVKLHEGGAPRSYGGWIPVASEKPV